jgi:pyridoxal phosphate enzyme (YggS family)
MSEITKNVERIKRELANGNPFGEQITVVGAVKMQSVDAVNEAILAGLDAVAENKAQDFRDKNEAWLPCPRHFIGHLQTNKVKYLIGKVELFHSCDRDELADEIARLSLARGVVSNVLIQVNISSEISKGGYALDEAKNAYERLSTKEGLLVQGFMAMLPNSDDEAVLRSLAKQMRSLFEWGQTQSHEIKYLSMGMSGDYSLCVEEGSNMVRLGSNLFGARQY